MRTRVPKILIHYLDERTFLHLVRKMAFLAKMDHVDQLDNICRKHPRLMSFKLYENYCAHCDEYQQGFTCRELGCKARKGYCIPKENTLGSFELQTFSQLYLERIIQTRNRNDLFLLASQIKDRRKTCDSRTCYESFIDYE